MKATIISPLSNVEAPHVSLRDRIEIAPLRDHMSEVLGKAWDARLIRHPSRPTHCLVMRDRELKDEDLSDAKAAVEEVVLRLRLLKPGDVYFDFGLVDQKGWFDSPSDATRDGLRAFGVFFYVVWSRKGFGQRWALAADEVEELNEILQTPAGEKLMERPPFRYFFKAYHEPYVPDRFLNNAIALENLLVNDEDDRSNITYKFVDRGCFLLHRAKPHAEGARGYESRLKAIYKSRSQLVHTSGASTDDWGAEEKVGLVKDSEQYLRILLRYVLSKPEFQKSTNVDDAKRKCFS